jgi:hypothetical protein
MKEIKDKLENQGRTTFEVGVGLCTGSLSIAIVGAEQRKQYTVIGDTVNVASRIQGMSRELGAPVLIHERTYLMAKHCIDAEKLRPVKLKGKAELVNVYKAKAVLDIKPYPGDEIKDLDQEVQELHNQMEEERKLKMAIKEKFTQEGLLHPEKSLPIGVRPRTKRDKFEIDNKATKISDDSEPVEEQEKGSVLSDDNE